MKKLSRKQAKEFHDSLVYVNWDKKDIARFQLFQDRLCIPFSIWHKSIEVLLNRSVWTHEFADMQRLRNEYLTTEVAPTLEEIINMIPEEKRTIIAI